MSPISNGISYETMDRLFFIAANNTIDCYLPFDTFSIDHKKYGYSKCKSTSSIPAY